MGTLKVKVHLQVYDGRITLRTLLNDIFGLADCKVGDESGEHGQNPQRN